LKLGIFLSLGMREEFIIKIVPTSVVFKDLWLEDKDKGFPRGQQHWVTVKNGILTDIYQ